LFCYINTNKGGKRLGNDPWSWLLVDCNLIILGLYGFKRYSLRELY
jgi:hypothetical protein